MFGDPKLIKRSIYCPVCGSEYSAHKGDYWDTPLDHVFTCCGVESLLVEKTVVIKEVE